MIGMSSSWMAMRGNGIKPSVDKIFGMGFDLVELGAAHRYEPKTIDIVKMLKRRYPDKRFTVHALFPPLDEFYFVNIADREKFDLNVRILKGMFKVGKIVGADVIGIHGGYKKELKEGENILGFTKIVAGRDIGEDEGRGNIEKIVKIGIELAEESGIRFCIENDAAGIENGFMVKPSDFEWLLSLSDSDHFGVLIDIGHLHISAKKFGFEEYKFVRKVRDRVFEMHVHDCNAKGDSHITTGVGVIDFEKYFNSIGSRANDIPLIFEYNNRVDVRDALKSKEYVESILKV